jgi:hypothetical protein
MKRIIFTLLILLFASSVYSAGPAMMCGQSAGGAAGFCDSGCAGTTILCWIPTTTTVECSDDDTTAAATGEIDVSTAPGYVTLVDNTGNGNDYYEFASTSFSDFPAGAFTLEMTVNLSVVSNNGVLLHVTYPAGAGNNLVRVSISTAAGNDIIFNHTGAGTEETNTFNTNLSTSTAYSLVLTADTANGMDVSIDGGANWIGIPASSVITTMDGTGTGSTAVRFGNDAAVNVEGTIKNMRIKSGWKTGY